MEKKKIILPTKRFFKAEEEDLDLRLNLDSSENLMRLGDRDIVLDIAQLFSDERNDSKNYKLYGKLKMVFRNMYSGSTTYEPLQKNLYLSGDGSDNKFGGFLAYNELAFLRNDVLREIYVPLSGTTPTFGTTTILTGTTNTGHTITTPITAPYKNWNIYVSYVHSHNTQFPMKYSLSGTSAGETISFTSGDGIPFRVTTGDTYVTLTSPVEHGMSAGENIILSATTLTTHFWVSGITYSKDDIIHYSNKIYTSKSNGNFNNEPPITGNTYWKLVTNWSLTETYDINNLVFYSGSTYKSLTNSNLNNTPPVTGTTSSWIRTSNRQYYTLPITSDTEKYRIFNIDNVGNQIYNSEKYIINILISEFSSGTTLDSVVFGRRCTDVNDIIGTTSQYYVHQHKTLTTEGDYILDKIGFESPIWEDERKLLIENSSGDYDVIVERNRMESLIYDFKEPLVLTGITNNLGYTPTDVYLTIIYRNANGYFNYPPKVGWKFNFHNTWIDNHFSGATSNETSIGVTGLTGNTGTTGFTAGLPLQIGTSGLTGAYVEYNKNELKERIISEAFHKITNPISIFNHNQDGNVDGFSGATSGNTFGLYYQPYYRIKLKELSPYVETAKTNDIINLPENTLYFEKEGLWKWRDLYDHGYIDPDGYGVNHPFINNIHYVKNDINFYLRNERLYQNKNDGLTNFNDKTITDC
jgi:hypothetical protein